MAQNFDCHFLISLYVISLIKMNTLHSKNAYHPSYALVVADLIRLHATIQDDKAYILRQRKNLRYFDRGNGPRLYEMQMKKYEAILEELKKQETSIEKQLLSCGSTYHLDQGIQRMELE